MSTAVKVTAAIVSTAAVTSAITLGITLGLADSSDNDAAAASDTPPALAEQTSSPPTEASEPTESTEPPEPTPTVLDTGPFSFGETYFGRRGNITVSEPRPYIPSRWAATERADKRWIIVTVTVENISKRVQSGDNWYAEVSADGRAGGETYDSGKVNSDPPDILPGRTGTWDIILGLPTPQTADVVISIEYGWLDPIYWEGPA